MDLILRGFSGPPIQQRQSAEVTPQYGRALFLETVVPDKGAQASLCIYLGGTLSVLLTEVDEPD